MRVVTVIIDHTGDSSPPLIVKKGELVQCEKKETEWEGWLWCRNSAGMYAWVPEAYVEPSTESGSHHLRQEYNSKELSVTKGDELIVMFEESSWAWVRTHLGEEGWVPLRNLKDVRGQPDSVPDLRRK